MKGGSIARIISHAVNYLLPFPPVTGANTPADLIWLSRCQFEKQLSSYRYTGLPKGKHIYIYMSALRLSLVA